MSKKILIVSASPRKNSNSEALANAFARGAAESGNAVEQISLRGKDIQGERDVASSRLEILFPHSRLKRTRHGCAGFRPRP